MKPLRSPTAVRRPPRRPRMARDGQRARALLLALSLAVMTVSAATSPAARSPLLLLRIFSSSCFSSKSSSCETNGNSGKARALDPPTPCDQRQDAKAGFLICARLASEEESSRRRRKMVAMEVASRSVVDASGSRKQAKE
eukprot:6178221-Pleurochrysis_carterae.AAC.1